MYDIFLDTDVAFDIISKREPHYPDSLKILQMAAEGKVKLFISESSLATLFYLSFDIYKLKDATSKLGDFVGVCELVSGGKKIAMLALQSGFKDKEDALQYYMAIQAKCTYFITRNIKDYSKNAQNISLYTPARFVEFLDTGRK